MHVTYSHGSVLFWWHCDMLCTSGFVDDVIHVMPIMERNRQCRTVHIQNESTQKGGWIHSTKYELFLFCMFSICSSTCQSQSTRHSIYDYHDNLTRAYTGYSLTWPGVECDIYDCLVVGCRQWQNWCQVMTYGARLQLVNFFLVLSTIVHRPCNVTTRCLTLNSRL